MCGWIKGQGLFMDYQGKIPMRGKRKVEHTGLEPATF